MDATLEAYERQVDVLPTLEDLLALVPPPNPGGWDRWITPLAGHSAAGIYATIQAPYRLLLESTLPGTLGRWSFLTGDPLLLLWHRGGRTYLRVAARGQTGGWDGDPFAALQALMPCLPPPPLLPTPFSGGWAGYFGYDLRHWVERLPPAADDLGLPWCLLGFYDRVLTCDPSTEQLIATAWGGAGTARAHWQPVLAGGTRLPEAEPPPVVGAEQLRRTFTAPAYQAAVQTVKDHIAAGDIYQANLSQRFGVPIHEDPWQVYLRLRATNPAPFAAYLPLGEATLISASPERFLQVSDRRVVTRPIKGTRPRDPDPGRDRRLAEELRHSTKDQAENVMIVDLLRNDLGRVCAIGSVQVPELLALESYATVHHLVSTIVGELAPGCDRVDLLRACWPGGSITGAPKIRAMEIINDLEPVARGPYYGSIGYLSVTGQMDTNLVIRTVVVHDGWAYVWAGGGIVADSDPAAEYRETLDKAAALLRALGVAPYTLDG